jgi:hypothetical protein
MPKILFDATGMFKGKRLRALDSYSRYLYPYILMLADLYGRVELDEEAIYEAFISFKDANLTPSKIKQVFDVFEQNQLCFIYKSKRSRWAQFDTPTDMRREYPSIDDNRSPEPPEPDYTEWLKSIHDEDWEKFHMGKHNQSISEKRSAAGKAGAAATNAKRWGQQSQQNVGKSQQIGNGRQTSPVVVAVAGVVDVDVVGEGAVAQATDLSYSLSDSSQNSKTQATEQQAKAPETAPEFVAVFRKVVDHNPHFDAAKLPKAWEKLWEKDFRSLLESGYDPATVRGLIAVSQVPSQAGFNVRPAALITNAERLLKMVAKLKADGAWEPVRQGFIRAATTTPTAATPSFSLEEEPDELADDEPDELADEEVEFIDMPTPDDFENFFGKSSLPDTDPDKEFE